MKRLRILSALLALSVALTFSAYATNVLSNNISSWAVDEITRAERAGLLTSIVADDSFIESLGTDYTADITREQFASLIVGLIESSKGLVWDPLQAGEMHFKDTTSYAVQRAYEIGVVQGTGDTSFSPELTMTREQMATMLYRAIEVVDADAVPGPAMLDGYKDVGQIADWAYAAVSSMAGCGIIEGGTDKRLAPKENVSIEQAIVLTYRSLGQAISPQAKRLAESYVSGQTTGIFTDSRLDSIQMVEVYQESGVDFLLYSIAFSLKTDKPGSVETRNGVLDDGWFTPSQPTILVLQLGAGGKFICQGEFTTGYTADGNQEMFSLAFQQFLKGGTALPYTYPQSGKITNTIGAYEKNTYQYTPTRKMSIEEITHELTKQVLDDISAREDMAYKVLDYRVTTIYDIELNEEDSESYWTAWPAFEMKYIGWYGLIGPSDGAWWISDFGTDGGISRVRIDEKNGTYTLRCWAP